MRWFRKLLAENCYGKKHIVLLFIYVKILYSAKPSSQNIIHPFGLKCAKNKHSLATQTHGRMHKNIPYPISEFHSSNLSVT